MVQMFQITLLLLFQTPAMQGTTVFWLGGIFDKSDVAGRMVFHLATETYSSSHTTLKSQILSISNEDDVIDLVDKTCSLLLAEPIVILTSMKWRASETLRSLCEYREVPFIMAKFDYSSKVFLNSLNLYPMPRTVGLAASQLVKMWHWKSGIILFQDSTGLVQIQELVDLVDNNQKPVFSVQQLNPERHFKPQLKVIREFRRVFHFVIQADITTVQKFISDAEEMDMLSVYYHYVFIDLDVSTLNLLQYRAHGCNITLFRLVNDQSGITKRIMAKMKNYNLPNGMVQPFRENALPTYLAVIHDSVEMIAKTAAALKGTISPQQIDCRNGTVWRDGTTFMNFIKATAYEGSTGHIQFDSYGRRINYTLNILELTHQGYMEYARWNEERGLRLMESEDAKSASVDTLENKVLRVTAYMEEPFVMHKKSVEKLTGNDRYEGFCVDLLQKLAQLNKFNYTIHEVKDKSYGTPDATGRWSGLIGELVRGEADLAVASVTINYVRSEVIDFSVPFMHLGISILYKKPERTPPSLLSFLAPLSLDVWMYMAAAYVVVSVMLWLVAYISPSEWISSQSCSTCNVDKTENQFSLGNSFWFTIGSLMQQGCDIAPRALGTRMVASVWWFFTLILISSYTANLAAFLTVERMEYTINSAEDLAKQTKIKYGTLNHSKIPIYEKMWNSMKNAHPPVFVNGSREGIDRVKQGSYAYLMESTMLEYAVERDCELTQVGGLLDSKGYGIGLRKGSPYREPISQAILYLQEKTVLTELKEKWWKRRAGSKCLSSETMGGTAAELGLQNVGGVFVVMVVGMIFALAITVAGKWRSHTVKKAAKTKIERSEGKIRKIPTSEAYHIQSSSP